MGSSGVWFLLPPPHRWVLRWAPPRKGMMLVEALSLNGRQVILATCTRVTAEHQSSLDKCSCGLYRWSEDSWAPGYGDNDFYLIGWTLRFDVCWMGQKGFLMCINTKQKERMSCSFNTEPESLALISLYGKVVSCRIYHTSSLWGKTDSRFLSSSYCELKPWAPHVFLFMWGYGSAATDEKGTWVWSAWWGLSTTRGCAGCACWLLQGTC